LVERSALLTHRFRAPAERVWEALADTARYNEAAGFPRHAITEIARGDGTRRFQGRARVGPFDVAWDDLPCNWVRGRWFEHTPRRRVRPWRAPGTSACRPSARSR
jgi:uncharacterized protein YndB with AHSA1/START domain